jgi:hypothetical protein
MVGLGAIATGAAPLVGGALLGVAAGQLKGGDPRGPIKEDLELLERLPEDEVARREALRRSINDRIDDMIRAADKRRQLRAAATSYQGSWRDILLFLCAVLFTIVWWHVSHARTNWLPVFIAMTAACVVTPVYAFRGSRRAIRGVLRPTKPEPPSQHELSRPRVR